jgi:hypothetical protein
MIFFELPEWVQLLFAMAVGIFIAALLLPWQPKIAPRENLFTWFLGWACFWPYFLVFGVWEGIKAYRQAWWDFQSD